MACSQLEYYLIPSDSESRYDWACEQGEPIIEALTHVFDVVDRILYASATCPIGTFQSNEFCLTCDKNCGKRGCVESNNKSTCFNCASSVAYLEIAGIHEDNNVSYGTCRTEDEIRNDDTILVYFKDPHLKRIYKKGCPDWMYTSDDNPPICYGKLFDKYRLVSYKI